MQAFDTERFTHEGREFLISFYSDDSHGAPWEESDGHGPVRYIPDSEPLERGETVLADMPRGRYVYNFGAAILQASREGWGLCPEELQKLTARIGKKPSKGQIRAEAIRKDMDYLRGWCLDDWAYIGVGVQIIGADGEPEGDEFEHALWGVESCGDWKYEVAAELADGILAERSTQWRAALTEARARRYWASRDVLTVGA